ncbi:NifB/NifX family molybdenum-iron cluster-binding protein [Helicovermis profundi]|uniref:NifB/NifX family molybdenum-iron cluster-binding protein n=1 Tax=Helicovermis profundi TaxID=3065157 RepID=A0AAU9EB24_9FIRM|nr:NifB/NifX family molybdenum-iron cluster-binding protein [Clostridia bacterium S502]
MKIAFPSTGEDLKSNVNDNFARAEKFIIVDSETSEFIAIENVAASAQGGAGPKAAQQLIDNDVDILVAPRCGQNAFDLLKVGEVKLYKSVGEDIETTLKLFNENKLSELTDIHSGFHKHG